MRISQRNIIAFSVTMAPLAMAVALAWAGYSQTQGSWWSASVQLAILGGITVMIYGVNVQALPLHSGKQWRSLSLVAAQVSTGVLGGWLAGIGYGLRREAFIRTGHMLVLVGATLFLVNLMLLFTSPGARPPRIPWNQRSQQQKVDRMAIPFTMISGLMVVTGAGIGVALDYWRPSVGRWDLVWAHTMLLGFFFPMASGTSYHMLGRWSGHDFRSIRIIGIHLIGFLIGIPAMTIGLARDSDALFELGAISMATAMTAWAISIMPVAWRMLPAARIGIGLALIFMLVGIGLGVTFAIDPATGARLRTTHVVANLFGFAGLLISGVGYRYVPQLAEVSGMRWPALQIPQIILMSVGSAVGMLFMSLRMYGHLDAEAVLWPCLIGGFGMFLFAVNSAATFAKQPINSDHIGTMTSYDQY